MVFVLSAYSSLCKDTYAFRIGLRVHRSAESRRGFVHIPNAAIQFNRRTENGGYIDDDADEY